MGLPLTLTSSPPAVEVSTQAHDGTAPGYIFVAPERGGAGKGGAMIIDDNGQVVWFRRCAALSDAR